MIKNYRPEDFMLPEQATFLVSIYKFTYDFINPSLYSDIPCDVSQNLSVMTILLPYEEFSFRNYCEDGKMIGLMLC